MRDLRAPDFRRLMVEAVAAPFGDLGFERRGGGFFVRQMAPGYLARCLLLFANSSLGWCSASCAAGLANEPVERLVAELSGRRYNRNRDGDMTGLVNYCDPMPSTLNWQLHGGGSRFDRVAAEMAGMVRDSFVPFAERHLTLESLEGHLEVAWNREPVVRPIAVMRWMRGDDQGAREVMDGWAAHLRATSGYRRAVKIAEFDAFRSALDGRMTRGLYIPE